MKYVKKTPMMVGFDLDGVIIDHTENKIHLASERGFHLDPKETASDTMRRKLPVDVYADIQHHLYADIPVPKEPPLMNGALSALAVLKGFGVPFVLISQRRNPEAAIMLLERHHVTPQYFTPDKLFFVDEPEDKNTKAREAGVTHFVDDEIRVLSVLSDVSCRILFDPHGAYPFLKEYRRIGSFTDLISFFKSQFEI